MRVWPVERRTPRTVRWEGEKTREVAEPVTQIRFLWVWLRECRRDRRERMAAVAFAQPL